MRYTDCRLDILFLLGEEAVASPSIHRVKWRHISIDLQNGDRIAIAIL